MKAYEKLERPDEFIVGTFPKISIDFRIHVVDSHNAAKRPLEYVKFADNLHNAELAFFAAQKVFEMARPAYEFIEAIKIWYFWNVNLLDRTVELCASVVIVDPVTSEKARVVVRQGIGILPPNSAVDDTDRRKVTDLVNEVKVKLRRKVEDFAKSRADIAPVARYFDSLFSGVDMGHLAARPVVAAPGGFGGEA